MYRYLGLDSNGDYKFSLMKNNKTIIISNKIHKCRYSEVQEGDFVIYEKCNKNAFKGSPRHNVGDIIFVNNPDRYYLTYDGLKVRKATQYELDKFEFNNFSNISCNSKIYKFMMSFY